MYNDRDHVSLCTGGAWRSVALEDKYDRVKTAHGSRQGTGYVLYDEVNDVLPGRHRTPGRNSTICSPSFDGAGIEILEEAKLEFEKKLEEGEEFSISNCLRTSAKKPTIPSACTCARWARCRCSRAKAKIEIARRIERGQSAVSKRSPVRRW